MTFRSISEALTAMTDAGTDTVNISGLTLRRKRIRWPFTARVNTEATETPIQVPDIGRHIIANPWKRSFDIVVAIALILFLAPFMVVLGLVVRIDGGPAVFGHRRLGANGKTFKCWKFRSMVTNSQEMLAQVLANDPVARAEWERDYKLRNDPRITLIGRFLRKTSLDELPQIFNVLKGEMSLVGPRPIVVAERERYGDSFAHYSCCRPGITGLWQVSGRNDCSYDQRVALDRHYVETWRFKTDIIILCKTVIVITRRDGAY